MQQDSGSVESGTGGVGREDGSVEERVFARARDVPEDPARDAELALLQATYEAHHELPRWVTPRFARTVLLIFCFGLVAVSIFQATDNYFAHRSQARQGKIIA